MDKKTKKLIGGDLLKVETREKWTLGSQPDKFSCTVQVGYRGYSHVSGEYETYRIQFSAAAADFRRIAIAILACAIGGDENQYLPVHTAGLVKGIKIVVARPVNGQPKSFTYTPKRKLKRYPWYPWSLSCDALTELPTFGIVGVPGERDHLLWDNRRDLRKPYAIWIGGYPKGLIRLARLLLDYANTDMPPEEIDLEIEGGFRGVGPCSYEARFERIDR